MSRGSSKSENIAATVLADELERLRKEKKAESLTELTKDIHFYPDLHGQHNRHQHHRCGY